MLCAIEERTTWIETKSQILGRAFGKNPDDRDDLAQEAALKALEVFGRYPDADRAFVLRCMQNHLLTVLRKRKVRRNLLDTALFDGTDDKQISHWNGVTAEDVTDSNALNPFDVAARSEELGLALDILQSLPDDQRLAMVASVTTSLAGYVRESPGLTRRRAIASLGGARSSAKRMIDEREMACAL